MIFLESFGVTAAGFDLLEAFCDTISVILSVVLISIKIPFFLLLLSELLF